MLITSYEKTESYCGACKNMAGAYVAWLEANTDMEPFRFNESAEENVDKLIEMGAQVAPVWVIDYEDGTEPKLVIGDNPEELTEALDSGKLSIWD